MRAQSPDQDAHIAITVFFADREAAGAGPYRVTLPAERTRHIRFNQLDNPEPIPKDTGYAGVLESDVPVLVQHTRLDSRQAELGLISTIAFAADCASMPLAGAFAIGLGSGPGAP